MINRNRVIPKEWIQANAKNNSIFYNMKDMSTGTTLTRFSLRRPDIIPVGLKVSVGKSLRPAIRKIVTNLNPDKIILFGSFAYGTPNPHSDVDLLVIMKTHASQKDRSWAVSRLLLPRPFPVDILVKTPMEIESDLCAGVFLSARY